MITSDDLRNLISAQTDPAVSVFMPTHGAGAKIQQDLAHLRNLLDDAVEQLATVGYRRPAAEALMAPARLLAHEGDFWAQQDQGLALFVASDFLRYLRLPFTPNSKVRVGRRFHITPLLPFETLRHATQRRLGQLLGEAEARATAEAAEIVTAAHDGRVDILFLSEEAELWGRYDEGTRHVTAHDQREAEDEDLLDDAAAQTLLQGGHVLVMAKGALPGARPAAALLRH